MSNPVTIDQLGPDASVRWAKDQEELLNLDIPLIETSEIPKHFELPFGTVIQTKWEELFDTHQTHPFAQFTQPKGFDETRKPLFKTHLANQLQWVTDEDAEIAAATLISKLKDQKPTSTLIEKDRDALISLIKQVGHLNDCVQECDGFRGQYQKS